jgi:uncharacterized protein YuzE
VVAHPGLNLELDANGKFIGVEILQASLLLKEVIEPLMHKAASGLEISS